MIELKLDSSEKKKEKKEKKVGSYKVETTRYSGIYKILDKPGYVVILNYGKKLVIDKKNGKQQYKLVQSSKKVDSIEEAKKLQAEVVNNRLTDTEHIKYIDATFNEVIPEFINSMRYTELGDSYRQHYDNYINHFKDFFGEIKVSAISTITVEEYFKYEKARGCLGCAHKNKDGSISKKENISINTLHKHKTALKTIWQFLIDSKKYNIKENVVIAAQMPKTTIYVNGLPKVVSKDTNSYRPLALNELNYILNDSLANEFDRSIMMMIGLASICGLRHGEIVSLRVGNVLHDDSMLVSEESFKYGNFNMEYYKNNSNLMLIDRETIRLNHGDKMKLPKADRIRIVAVPECMKAIIDYYITQRLQFEADISGDSLLFRPIINIIENKSFNSEKLADKWLEYKIRCNKRRIKSGLAAIDFENIRLHDLRHTHASLLMYDVPDIEISYNMGHKVKGNTTQVTYMHDIEPRRDEIIKYFDNYINLDWSKQYKADTSKEDLFVNGSGHLAIK